MFELGKYNTLRVAKFADFGVYLDAGDKEILLPKRYLPEKVRINDELKVFIYLDSENRVIATTLEPHAIVDEFGCMKVREVNDTGAFLDWGIQKDLLVPFREQAIKMEEGKSYVVKVLLDKQSNRIIASSRLNNFVSAECYDLITNDEVDILITSETDLGYKAIVNNEFWGLLYKSDLKQKLNIGDKLKAYVKTVREDDKLDLSLRKSGYELVDDAAGIIIEKLKFNKGKLMLNDHSSPDEIERALNMSKKTFKKTIGTLFKKRMIRIYDDRIELI